MSTDMFDLLGKVAIVTGASRGLGQYFGRALAGAGHVRRRGETLEQFGAVLEARERLDPAVAVEAPLDDGIQRRVPRSDGTVHRPALLRVHRQVTVGVKGLVRQAQLPIWPEERPETLVWIAIEDVVGKQVLAEGGAHRAAERLERGGPDADHGRKHRRHRFPSGLEHHRT